MLTQTTTTQQWKRTYNTWLAGFRASTAGSYGGIYRLFFNHLADLQPWQVTAAHARAWIAHLENKNRSPRTIYNHLAALASFYNAAQAAGLCQSNPIAPALAAYYRTYKPDGHRHKPHPRKHRSQYQDAFLDDDGPSWLAAVLGLRRFVNAGCCTQYGTMPCLHCTLARLIPRHDCSPPTDCPTCPQRTSCPCGDDDLRRRLQGHPKYTGEKTK